MRIMKLSFYLEEKKYRNGFILENIELNLRPKKCVGLIGPNGSGKTTLINSLFHLTDYKGTLKLNGEILNLKLSEQEYNLFNRYVGYISDETLLFEFLTLNEYFDLLNKNFNNELDYNLMLSLVNVFKLEKYIDLKVGELSFGTKKKIQIIIELIKKPRFLVFDEPTNGLDPEMIIILKTIIRKLLLEGTSVLISTHQLKFCEDIASDILMIQDGNVMLNDSIENISELFKTGDLEYIYKNINKSYYKKVSDLIDEIQF